MNIKIAGLMNGVLGILILGSTVSIAHAQSVKVTPSFVQVSEVAKQIPIARDLKLGSSGDDVKALQKVLASIAGIYPEKLVTGYYGSLTEKAVGRLQVKYKLTSSGVVSGDTLKKVNELQSESNTAPTISALTITPLSYSSSMVSWKTDQLSTTEIFYSSAPFTTTSDKLTVKDMTLSRSHAVEITRLSPSTKYYFTIVSANTVSHESSRAAGEFITKSN